MIEAMLARIDELIEKLNDQFITEQEADAITSELAEIELKLQDYPDYRRGLKFGNPL